MTLVDSSSWIHCLRGRGDPVIRERVGKLVREREAAWCPQVRVELWNGVRSEADRIALRKMEQTLPEFDITSDVWELACEMAERCRGLGRTTPAGDLVIAACAKHHGVNIDSADKHFDWLTKL